MRQGRSTGTQTREEAAWFDAITRHGCVCCIELGYEHDPDGYRVEQHHLLSGGIRMGHLFSVGLCCWHHRARILLSHWSLAQHRIHLGPSLLEGSVTFERRFGDNDWLLQRQLDILAVVGLDDVGAASREEQRANSRWLTYA